MRRRRQSGTTRITGRALIAAIVMGAVILGYAGPAQARASEPARPLQDVVVEGQALSTSGAFSRVGAAGTDSEKVQLLEQAGFVRVSATEFESHAAGLVLGYRLPMTPIPQVGASHMSVGWNWGPYIRGTLREWQNFIAYGAVVGGGACALITNALGSGACIALAGIATKAISDLRVPDFPHSCIAIQGVRWWAERC